MRLCIIGEAGIGKTSAIFSSFNVLGTYDGESTGECRSYIISLKGKSAVITDYAGGKAPRSYDKFDKIIVAGNMRVDDAPRDKLAPIDEVNLQENFDAFVQNLLST